MRGFRRSVRAWALGLLLAALALPSAAVAQSPAACANLAHQLVHYDTLRERAAEAGNSLWLGRLDRQIGAVEDQLAARCPDEYAAVRDDQQWADLLRLAAQGALTFFTLGAY